MAHKKSIVTGGAGFVGSHIVRALLERGDEVHVIDNFSAGRREEWIEPRATYHELDIRNTKELLPIVRGASVVFHAAALPSVQYSLQYPEETHAVNVDGTLAVLEAARVEKVARVVFMSSASCYGDADLMPLVETMPVHPKSPYALHKCMGELMMRTWAELYHVQTVSLRCFNIYGPGMSTTGAYASAIGTFITQRLAGKPLTIVGDGSQTRDYVHVSDVAKANLAAAASEKVGAGEIINIGSGIQTPITAIADMIGGDTVALPPWVEPHDSVASVTMAEELLGWKPSIALADGIRELKTFMRVPV